MPDGISPIILRIKEVMPLPDGVLDALHCVKYKKGASNDAP